MNRTKMILPSEVAFVLTLLNRMGHKTLIVGGAVRDFLMGYDPKDWDIEVYGLTFDELAEFITPYMTSVNMVGKSFGILKVSINEVEMDLNIPRRESKTGKGHKGFKIEPDHTLTVEEAAERRDFTMNSAAWDQKLETLVYPFPIAVSDIRNRVLRATSPLFQDDPLRPLRGFQFAARFEMEMEPATVKLCRTLVDEYDTLSKERIWQEWYKWCLKGVKPSLGLKLLKDIHWLQFYPELGDMIGCFQNPEWHPEGDCWEHMLEVCDAAAIIADREGMKGDERVIYMLACLCHDLGKPATTVWLDGAWRAPKHAAAGEDPTLSFLDRIGCESIDIRDKVVALVKEHMSHLGFFDNPSHRTVRRLSVRLGKTNIKTLTYVIEADRAGRGELSIGRDNYGEDLRLMLEYASEVRVLDSKPEKILLGRHLLALDEGWEPGVNLGLTLKAAYQAQLDGEFNTIPEAQDWVREWVKS